MGRIAPPRYGPVEDLARGIGTAAKLQPMARYGTAKMYTMMTAYGFDRKLRADGKARHRQLLVAWGSSHHAGCQRYESDHEENHDESLVHQVYGMQSLDGGRSG